MMASDTAKETAANVMALYSLTQPYSEVLDNMATRIQAAIDAQVAALTRERDIAVSQNRATLDTWEKALDSFNRTAEKLTRERDSLREALQDLVRQLPTDERLADFNLDHAEAALATPEENQDGST